MGLTAIYGKIEWAADVKGLVTGRMYNFKFSRLSTIMIVAKKKCILVAVLATLVC